MELVPGRSGLLQLHLPVARHPAAHLHPGRRRDRIGDDGRAQRGGLPRGGQHDRRRLALPERHGWDAGPTRRLLRDGRPGHGVGWLAGREPAGTTLPFAPAYFPHVVRNADGSLTGYFDYRPKDADEAIVAAQSTDGATGPTKARPSNRTPATAQRPTSTTTARDTPTCITSAARQPSLHAAATRRRQCRASVMLVHTLATPRVDHAPRRRAGEREGGHRSRRLRDRNVAHRCAHQLAGLPSPLTTTARSAPAPSSSSRGVRRSDPRLRPRRQMHVINCTVASGSTLTGCTTAASDGLTRRSGDLIEQVLGHVSAKTSLPGAVPTGPNTPTGDGGIRQAVPVPSASVDTITTDNGCTIPSPAPSTRTPRTGCTSTGPPSTAPSRTPTRRPRSRTARPARAARPLWQRPIVTSDPIIPRTAAATTTGLVAPDGIVGTLPSYPAAPCRRRPPSCTPRRSSTTTSSATTTNAALGRRLSSIASPSPLPVPDAALRSAPARYTVDIGDTRRTRSSDDLHGLTTGTDTADSVHRRTRSGDKISKNS